MTATSTEPTAPMAPTGTDRPVLLSLQDVSRTHGEGTSVPVRALRGVSLDVRIGELVAVMGPSGSGKSTLLHLAGGLDVPTAGDVVLDGVRVAGLSLKARAALRRRSVGYVFQDLNLIPALTAVENVMLPRELDGVSTRQARRQAWAVLGEVDVRDLADRFPDEMSGGQQQRVAIARALVGPRRLVLADEPTGALDSMTGESIMKVLRARVDAGAAGLLVTHDAQHAAWADRVVFLRDGEVVDETSVTPAYGIPVPGPPAGGGPAGPVPGREGTVSGGGAVGGVWGTAAGGGIPGSAAAVPGTDPDTEHTGRHSAAAPAAAPSGSPISRFRRGRH